ncbi:hypothetical protein [Streptomyces sp. NPDC093261]|uniref:hypothetical protein n=1 Tax=Streptomyces sp. NPDC093261 TaxID=3366037 RepID=UPI003824D1DB
MPNGGKLSDHYPVWVSLAAVPAARGNYPLTTQAERNAAFGRFCMLTGEAVTTNMQPDHPILIGRRQLRFEGNPTGQLHQDGSFYAALPLYVQSDRCAPEEPMLLHQRGLELDVVVQVQAAAAWAAAAGSSGDLMLSAALLSYVGSDVPLRLVVGDALLHHAPVSPVPAMPAQTTADLTAITTDKHEAVIAAYTLVSDLLADMGTHQPDLLTPQGDIAVQKLGADWRAKLTGWE